jgi:hypothetical protein
MLNGGDVGDPPIQKTGTRVTNSSSLIISNDKPATAIINHSQKRDATAIRVKIYPLRPIPANIYKPILPFGRNPFIMGDVGTLSLYLQYIPQFLIRIKYSFE